MTENLAATSDASHGSLCHRFDENHCARLWPEAESPFSDGENPGEAVAKQSHMCSRSQSKLLKAVIP